MRGIRQKIRRGELSAKAPLGYFNEPRLRTIEPDKKIFRKVKEVLTVFATGECTLTKIQSKMFSLGLVGKEGKPLHLSTIQGILKNPFYYGHFLYRGELHQGSHKPMISKKLFDQIQEALITNGKPRKKRGPKNFQFLNFAVCGKCGYTITAERKIKKSGRKYHYYHCTFKSKTQKCSQTRFLREEKFAEQIKDYVQKVSLPDDWREKYLAKVNEWEKGNRQSSDFFAQNLKTELENVKTKINRLMDAYLEGDLELPEFQLKKNSLMSEKKTLEEKLSDFERKGNHWLELVRNWIIEANQAKNFALSESFPEMKNLLKKIGSNRRIFDQRLFVDFKKPWNHLYFLPAEARAPSEARGEGERNRLMWCLLDEIRTHFEQNPEDFAD
ncbi:MAG: recombinase family protein [Candidatus Portnoybacteria bacterium]|nr:recombinase family protein [Candidatus Portnoybacteria bacterium]